MEPPPRGPCRDLLALNSGCMSLVIIMVSWSSEIYAQDGSMDFSAKYSCAHSHAWVTGHSNSEGSEVYAWAQSGFVWLLYEVL